MEAPGKTLDTGYLPGLALCGAIAVAAMSLAGIPAFQQAGLSAMTLSILIGIGIGNTFFPHIAAPCRDGVDFSRNRLLRLGIILYGFRITFAQVMEIGWAGIVIDMLVIFCTFTLAVQIGTRLLGMDRQTAMLIGAGSAICGAAAVMATAPVVRGPAHKISVAMATVVVFGTIAMFLYPLLYPYLGMSEVVYGRYVGSTVHEVAQVVVAGKAVSEQAASVAVVEKMLRVMMLAPFLLLLSRRLEEQDSSANGHSGRYAVPWFAILFIVTAAVHSLGLIPAAITAAIVQADNALLAMAMAALGLRTCIGAIRQAGLKPILLAAVLFMVLMAGGYALNAGIDKFCAVASSARW